MTKSAVGEETGNVQSVTRVLSVLEALADAGGVASLAQLTDVLALPGPTIHRLLRTLVAKGYARQDASRQYALGPKLVRLGDAASRLLEGWSKPQLGELAAQLGESANFALLDGHEVVYVAQAPGNHAMRMFTEVGHRAGVHCTAVGKAILATYPPYEAAEMLARTPMDARTPYTITSLAKYLEHLDFVRSAGFATDVSEQEIGVSCIAVALPETPARGAVSISGPQTRMTDELMSRAVPLLHDAARELARHYGQFAR